MAVDESKFHVALKSLLESRSFSPAAFVVGVGQALLRPQSSRRCLRGRHTTLVLGEHSHLALLQVKIQLDLRQIERRVPLARSSGTRVPEMIEVRVVGHGTTVSTGARHHWPQQWAKAVLAVQTVGTLNWTQPARVRDYLGVLTGICRGCALAAQSAATK